MKFLRIKPLDIVLATAEKKSLHRSLGAFQLTLLGIGAIIGTGIFVLTAESAQKAGPGMMFSFVVAGAVCAVAALCYSELSAMIPVSGSAYTYTYTVMGELLAWLVGWALILEYGVSASAVAVGWSGYFTGQVEGWLGIQLPHALTNGPYAGGLINLPAVIMSLIVTGLLIIGTRESMRVNMTLVVVKVVALAAFMADSSAYNRRLCAALHAPAVRRQDGAAHLGQHRAAAVLRLWLSSQPYRPGHRRGSTVRSRWAPDGLTTQRLSARPPPRAHRPPGSDVRARFVRRSSRCDQRRWQGRGGRRRHAPGGGQNGRRFREAGRAASLVTWHTTAR